MILLEREEVILECSDGRKRMDGPSYWQLFAEFYYRDVNLLQNTVDITVEITHSNHTKNLFNSNGSGKLNDKEYNYNRSLTWLIYVTECTNNFLMVFELLLTKLKK